LTCLCEDFRQLRLFEMTNHPPIGYSSSLRLLNTFKAAYPLEKFVTPRISGRSGGQGDGPSLRYRRLHEGRADAKRSLVFTAI
jgi:hypothetical protein